MHRLRLAAQDYLLPLVIGALVLRALIPVGFMPAQAPGSTLTVMLCNALATGGPATETLDIPGADASASALAMQCDFCLAATPGPPAPLPSFSDDARQDHPPAVAPSAAPPYPWHHTQLPRGPPTSLVS